MEPIYRNSVLNTEFIKTVIWRNVSVRCLLILTSRLCLCVPSRVRNLSTKMCLLFLSTTYVLRVLYLSYFLIYLRISKLWGGKSSLVKYFLKLVDNTCELSILRNWECEFFKDSFFFVDVVKTNAEVVQCIFRILINVLVLVASNSTESL